MTLAEGLLPRLERKGKRSTPPTPSTPPSSKSPRKWCRWPLRASTPSTPSIDTVLPAALFDHVTAGLRGDASVPLSGGQHHEEGVPERSVREWVVRSGTR